MTQTWNEENVPIEQQTLSYFWEGMLGYWELLGDQKRKFAALFLVILGMKSLEIAAPYMLKLVFDALPSWLAGGISTSYIVLCVVSFVILKIAIDAIVRFVRAPLFFEGLIALERDWPVQAHEKLMRLQEEYHSRENTGKTGAIVAKACDKLAAITDRLFWGLLPALSYTILNAVAIFFMDWRLGLLFFIPMIPAIWINLRSYGKFTPTWERWDTWKEKGNAYFYESLRNGTTVRLCAQEPHEMRRFDRIRSAMYKIDIRVQYPLQWYLFAIGMFMLAGYALTIAVSIYFVSIGQSDPGTVVFIIATGGITSQGLWEMVNNYTHIMRDLVSVTRMRKLLGEKETVLDTGKGTILPHEKLIGELSFDDVTFTYPGTKEPTLHNFSLGITPGEMVALVGPSGSGKSTVTKVLNRFYDVSGGAIRLDGRDIRTLDRSWYRRLFAVVLQDVQIFDTTLLDNITYGIPTVTQEEVEEALAASCLSETLADTRTFPDGVYTRVGEQGVKLSGGQRQRVGIARAYLSLLHDARFLVLDEATSALDSATEREVQKMIEMLRNKREDITIIAIAHRFSTIQSADRICVIERGALAECGDHQSLLKRNGLYARLAQLQRLGEIV